MHKLIFFTTLVILFMIFVLPAFLLYSLDLIPINTQASYGMSGESQIYGENIVSGNISIGYKNFTAIGVSIKNPNLKNNKDVFLNLYDEQGNLLRASKLNGFNVGDGAFVKFYFNPIPDSINKNYIYSFSSPGSTIADALFIYKTVDGGIPAVYYYKPENKLHVIGQMYSNLFARLLLQDSQKPL